MNNKKDNMDALGAVLLIMCSAIVGINQVIIKIVNTGLQPVFQAGLRSACAFFPVLIYAWVMKKSLTVKDGSFWPGMLAGLFFGFEFMLLFLALEFTTVARASILFYTMPIWAAVSAHFLIPGDRLTVTGAVGLLIAVLGVTIALSKNMTPELESTLIGDMMCIAASMLWAGIIILARKSKFSRACPEMQLLYQLAVSGIVLLLIAPGFGEPIRELDATIILLFLIQVFVVVGFSFLTWFWVLSIYPPSKVASFSFLSPVFGVLFGWLILDEMITRQILLSLILVCIGIYLVNRANLESAK